MFTQQWLEYVLGKAWDAMSEFIRCETYDFGRSLDRWIGNAWPTLTEDNWERGLHNFFNDWANNGLIVEPDNRAAFIAWLYDCSALMRGEPARKLEQGLYTPDPAPPAPWEIPYVPQPHAESPYSRMKPAPFDPEYPELHRLGNVIMDTFPPQDWLSLAADALKRHPVPEKIAEQFTQWLADVQRKTLGNRGSNGETARGSAELAAVQPEAQPRAQGTSRPPPGSISPLGLADGNVLDGLSNASATSSNVSGRSPLADDSGSAADARKAINAARKAFNELESAIARCGELAESEADEQQLAAAAAQIDEQKANFETELIFAMYAHLAYTRTWRGTGLLSDDTLLRDLYALPTNVGGLPPSPGLLESVRRYGREMAELLHSANQGLDTTIAVMERTQQVADTIELVGGPVVVAKKVAEVGTKKAIVWLAKEYLKQEAQRMAGDLAIGVAERLGGKEAASYAEKLRRGIAAYKVFRALTKSLGANRASGARHGAGESDGKRRGKSPGMELRPYGGPGGGHHVPAKKALEGAAGYNPKSALAIPNSVMRKLGVKHGVVTGAQRRLYGAFAKSGKPLTWEIIVDIETKALVAGGATTEQAAAAVRRAIQALKDSGVVGPTRIPWGG